MQFRPWLTVFIILSHCLLVQRSEAQSADDFAPQFYTTYYAIAVQSDGKIVLGGDNFLKRLNPDGSIDPTFIITGADPSSVNCIAIQSDRKILVGGGFTQLGGRNVSQIGRLNPDGSVDTGFLSDADGMVNCLAQQPDGKILVGGRFNFMGGNVCHGFGRLNTNGTIDFPFSSYSQALGTVHSLAIQTDGKIVLGGIFDYSGGSRRTNISRLNPDGRLDETFNPSVNGWVEALAVQADGKILVGGCFGSISGQARTNIARLNADGSVDDTFHLNAGIFTVPGGGSTFVFSLAVQSDGRILVGGSFDSLGGSARYGIGRLFPNGEVDPDFNPGTDGRVYGLALQNDGKVLLAGDFSSLGGAARRSTGRIKNNSTAVDRLSTAGDSIMWERGGGGPEFWRASFDVSTDGISWTNLGSGTRVTGGWSLPGITFATNAIIRARGFVAGAYHSGSGSFVERFLGQPVSHQPIVGLKLNGQLPILSIQGDLNRPYAIEFTSQIFPVTDWQPLTAILWTNNAQTFVDWSGSNSNYRLYRVRIDQ